MFNLRDKDLMDLMEDKGSTMDPHQSIHKEGKDSMEDKEDGEATVVSVLTKVVSIHKEDLVVTKEDSEDRASFLPTINFRHLSHHLIMITVVQSPRAITPIHTKDCLI